MLEIDILRNSSQKNLGVLRGAFSGFGCPKRHPDGLRICPHSTGVKKDIQNFELPILETFYFKNPN